MKVYSCEQLSDEWYAAKLGKVSASQFSKVLNKKTGRKTYMFKLLAERLSGEPQVSYNNKAMDDGLETEPRARAYYEALYGKVQQVGFVEINDYVGCSPDGLVGDDGLIEIKCPYSSTHLRYVEGNRLPADYVAQVQGQLWVTGRRWCDFISFDSIIKVRPFWKIRVSRDENYINNVLSIAVDEFVREMNKIEETIANKNIDF